ncbi:MAG: hypothetical protein SGILL_001877 [Bacillariaceae sp.]
MLSGSQEKDPWAVAHLITNEPSALRYIETDVDMWDDSTIDSSPSLQHGRGATTILRTGGEPSDIIISVERRISLTKRALRKFFKVLRTVFLKIARGTFGDSSGISSSSTEQPSLGVMGVIV